MRGGARGVWIAAIRRVPDRGGGRLDHESAKRAKGAKGSRVTAGHPLEARLAAPESHRALVTPRHEIIRQWDCAGLPGRLLSSRVEDACYKKRRSNRAKMKDHLSTS